MRRRGGVNEDHREDDETEGERDARVRDHAAGCGIGDDGARARKHESEGALELREQAPCERLIQREPPRKSSGADSGRRVTNARISSRTMRYAFKTSDCVSHDAAMRGGSRKGACMRRAQGATGQVS